MTDVITFDTMTYRVTSNGVAMITIDVQDRPVNVLTPELHRDVGRVADQLASDDRAIGAVIQSGKPSFMAGGDLKRIVGLYDMNHTAEEAYVKSRTFTESLRRLETCGKPVAVAINGTALGGGLELALACHYRVVLDDEKIALGLPETTLGLLPGAGGSQRLPRCIGIKAAAELILSGRPVGPSRALELGIVDRVVAADDMVAEAQRWVLEEGNAVQPWDHKGFQMPGGSGLNNPAISQLFQRLTSQVSVKTKRNYPAPIAALRCLFNGTTVSSMDVALQIESREFSALTRDPVARNMIRTQFLNKGSYDKLVHRPKAVEKSRITQVVLSGLSSHTHHLAFAFARAGIEVLVHDQEPGVLDNLRQAVGELLERNVASGRMTRDKADKTQAMICRLGADSGLAAAELVILTSADVPDDFAKMLELVPTSAIIAVSSPELSLEAIDKLTGQPERTLGWYFSTPADQAQGVEIVVRDATSDVALACIMDCSRQLRKTPMLQRQSPQYLSQRCIHAYIAAALSMVGEGVSPVLIENAALKAGFPTGPLALADTISLPVLSRGFLPAETLQSGWVIARLTDEMGCKGKSHGKGLYDYSDDGAKKLSREMAIQFPLLEQQPDSESVAQRLICVQALAAASYWETGRVDPIDADLISVLCWQFPSYTGGVLSYIDTLGLPGFVEQCEQFAQHFGDTFKPSEWLRNLSRTTDRVYAKVA